LITETIIEVLREDSTLQTLLGAASAASCPVFTTHGFQDTADKQINVSYDMGETLPVDQDAKTHDGIFRVYVLVKDTTSEPIKTAHTIAARVLALLDLKGSTLDDTDTIYWVQKTDSDINHYDNIHFFEIEISFRFVLTEA